MPVAGERWRELTLDGNARHAALDYGRAGELYVAALVEAEAVLSRELREAQSPQIIGPVLLTISHHNLAQLARMQAKPLIARRHVLLAFERLVGLAETAEVPLCIRTSAARNLRPALEELLSDLRTRRHEQHGSRLIARARAVVQAVEQAHSAHAH